MSRYRPIFAVAREAGISVTSNLNLWGEAYRDGRKVIAITGTKGKSTTATPGAPDAGRIRARCRASPAMSGFAPLEIADKHKIVVFELSSYQTADIAFTPDIAAITNLSPEHTDWHRTVERYYADKLNLIDRDAPFPVALGVGADNHPLVLEALRDPKRVIAPLAPFLHDRIATRGARAPASKVNTISNNALLAAQVAMKAGADIEGVIRGITKFTTRCRTGSKRMRSAA